MHNEFEDHKSPVACGGKRENTGGKRENTGGKRENAGGKRDGAGRPVEDLTNEVN